jgi:hypothetical protein
LPKPAGKCGVISGSVISNGSIVGLAVSGNADLFRYFVFAMGFGTGIAGAGMLTGLAHEDFQWANGSAAVG